MTLRCDDCDSRYTYGLHFYSTDNGDLICEDCLRCDDCSRRYKHLTGLDITDGEYICNECSQSRSEAQ